MVRRNGRLLHTCEGCGKDISVNVVFCPACSMPGQTNVTEKGLRSSRCAAPSGTLIGDEGVTTDDAEAPEAREPAIPDLSLEAAAGANCEVLPGDDSVSAEAEPCDSRPAPEHRHVASSLTLAVSTRRDWRKIRQAKAGRPRVTGGHRPRRQPKAGSLAAHVAQALRKRTATTARPGLRTCAPKRTAAHAMLAAAAR